MPPAHRIGERRRHCRVVVKGRAEVIVSEGQWMGEFEIENLSASGALLVGSAGIYVGEAVKVRLHLPEGEPVELLGLVRRVEPRGGERAGLGLEFSEISPEEEDLIQEAVLDALESGAAVAD